MQDSVGAVNGTQTGYILVVEDDRSIRELIVDILGDAGYPARAVALADQAADHLQDSACHLIVADFNAPYYTEETRDQVWEAALSEFRRATTVPIVVVTAHSVAASEDALERGVAAILLKPFQVDELLDTIEKILGPGAAA